MSKTKKFNRSLALLIMLALVLAVLPFGARATNPTSLENFGNSLSDISISGVNVTYSSLSLSYTTFMGYNNTIFTYTINLDAQTANSAEVTITFTKSANASSNCKISLVPPTAPEQQINGTNSLTHTVTLSNGNGTKTVFVHHDLINARGSCDTYVFNFVRNVSSATISTGAGLNMQFGDPNETPTAPECDMLFTALGNDNYDVVYAGTTVGYYPNSLALFVTSGAGTITDLDVTGGVTVQPTTKNNLGENEPTNDITSGFYIVTINSDGTLVFSVGTNHVTLYFNTVEPIPSLGAGVYAFLPAPGQFTNEGINTGGWGDIYYSGSNSLKGIVNGLSGTGVSLGFFGGYLVADMGEDILNAASHPYGVDFIVYGNAFANNSEPGCIQVAQAVPVMDGNEITSYIPGDANNDGIIWYDIAGSLHYDAGTVWNATFTYTNPNPDDNDDPATYPTGTRANVTYSYSKTARPGNTAVTGTSSLTANLYHNHSWYPLDANYFTARNSIGPMDHAGDQAMTFVTVNGNTAAFTGVLLGKNNNQTINYTFGYADVHPNGNTYGTAVNPYAANASSSGGDGIDISWAVKPDGTPVNLSSIRFVRIYTGSAHYSVGEVSTEVCGIYTCLGGGNEQTTSNPTSVLLDSITSVVPGTTAATIPTYYFEPESDIEISVTGPTGSYVYINGTCGTGSCTDTITVQEGDQIVRIIIHDGTTSNPYIGYVRLIGQW